MATTRTARRPRCPIDGESETRVVSRIFENREFGFLKVTVERPLRMNFEVTPERIAKLDEQRAFTNLAKSKKRKGHGGGRARDRGGAAAAGGLSAPRSRRSKARGGTWIGRPSRPMW